MVRDICGKAAIPYVIIRPSAVVGPSVNIPLVNAWLRRVAKGKTVFMVGDGTNLMHLTGLKDLVRALCLVGLEALGDGDVFNIASSRPDPIKELAEGVIAHAKSRSRCCGLPSPLAKSALTILAFLGLSPIEREYISRSDQDFVLDISKAKRVLGFEPMTTNIESLCEAYDHLVATL